MTKEAHAYTAQESPIYSNLRTTCAHGKLHKLRNIQRFLLQTGQELAALLDHDHLAGLIINCAIAFPGSNSYFKYSRKRKKTNPKHLNKTFLAHLYTLVHRLCRNTHFSSQNSTAKGRRPHSQIIKYLFPYCYQEDIQEERS